MNLLVAFLNQKKKVFGPFIAKRKLVNGTSWVVEIVNDKKISNLVLKIARLIDNQGTFNIQLKIEKMALFLLSLIPDFQAQHQLDRISVSMSLKCLSKILFKIKV